MASTSTCILTKNEIQLKLLGFLVCLGLFLWKVNLTFNYCADFPDPRLSQLSTTVQRWGWLQSLLLAVEGSNSLKAKSTFCKEIINAYLHLLFRKSACRVLQLKQWILQTPPPAFCLNLGKDFQLKTYSWELDEESMDKCCDHRTCVPLRTTSPSAVVEDGTCSLFMCPSAITTGNR